VDTSTGLDAHEAAHCVALTTTIEQVTAGNGEAAARPVRRPAPSSGKERESLPSWCNQLQENLFSEMIAPQNDTRR